MNRHPQSQTLIWESIRNANCTACALHENAKIVCLTGDGPVPCDAMIIGEAPGYTEDVKGIPFCGDSGLYLRRTLKEIGLDPRQIYITNTVACRPPGNRAPKSREIKACAQYLHKQIALVHPKVILILGNTALEFITGKKGGILKAESTTFSYGGDYGKEIPVIASRHPSNVVRLEGEEDYDHVNQKFRENLLLFKRTLLGERDEIKFKQVFPRLKQGWVYTDLESNGLDPFRDDAVIHTLGFAQSADDIYAMKNDPSLNEKMRSVLENYPIMAHRATFEGTWYRQKYGITPRIYSDTKLTAYLRNENEESGLKYQAIMNLGVDPWSEDQDFQNPDYEKMLPYNARDNKYGVRLHNEIYLPWLKKNPKVARLMRYILLPATEVLIEMICNGYHINAEDAKQKLEHVLAEQKKLNQKLNKIAGKEVNPGSPKQMCQLFYDQLRLTCPVKTEKGANSTSEANLVRLQGQHPAVDILWDWRGLDKKRSTYLLPWLTRGPVLHANYDPTGTDTGRLSSSMIKNKRGQKKLGAVIHQCPRDPFIRNLIVPRGYVPRFNTEKWKWEIPSKRNPKDWGILSADLSQIELRLVAHAAREETMIEIFRSNGDIHLATAMNVLRVAANQIEKETRKKAKAVNFGFVYGMFPPKFQAYAKESFGLDITLKEAKEYRRGYFKQFSGLEPWHRRVEAFVRQNGWVDNIFGRRRHLPEAMDWVQERCDHCISFEHSNPDPSCFICGGTGFTRERSDVDEWIQRENVRKGINSPIQGAGSDLLLLILALIASYSLPWDFKIDRQRALPIGTAHDSMLFEVHRSFAQKMRDGILWTVENLPLKKYFDLEMLVPIRMDVSLYEDCWEGKELQLGAAA